MQAMVVASNLSVQLGEHAWPFQISLREGSASIAIDGRVYEVRPLTWREKLRLTRFAHFGEPFIQARFLEASVSGPKSPAAPESTQAVLLALAMWINLPSEDRPGLPLDQRQLSRVTMELCRSLGMGPSAIGDLTAAEVEVLWHSLQHQPAMPLNSEADQGMYDTKIMIVPNEAPSPLESPVQPSPQSESPARPVAWRQGMPVASTGIADDDRARLGVPYTAHPSVDEVPPTASGSAAPRENEPERRTAFKRDLTTRFRVSFCRPTEKAPTRAPVPVPFPDALKSADSSQASTDMEPSSSLQVSTLSASSRKGAADKRWELHQAEIRYPQPEIELESILDEFCERLAEAAADLGITEEV